MAIMVVAVLVAPFAPRAASGAECDRDHRVVDRGDWVTVTRPKFPAGRQEIVDHMTDRHTRLVTNGTAIMGSHDRGCTWQTVWSVPSEPTSDYPYSADTAQIKGIEVMTRSASVLRVGVVVSENDSGVIRPHVVVGEWSRAGYGVTSGPKGTWRSGDSGLPPVGEPEVLAPAPGDPNVAFLGIDLAGGTLDVIYATTDAATSWSLRTSPADIRPNAGLTRLVVDPLDESQLWAGGTGGLYRSTDGGATFTAVAEFTGTAVGPIDVFHGSGEPVRLFVHRVQERDFMTSVGGDAWAQLLAPGEVTSIAHGNSATEVVITSVGSVWAFHAPSQKWVDMGAPVPSLADVVTSPGQTPVYTGRTANLLATYEASTGGFVTPGGVGDIIRSVGDIQTPDPTKEGRPSLEGRDKVVIGLGETKQVPYRLVLPERRVPLDLVFLLDTSDSMKKFTQGLVEAYVGIVNGLYARGIDVEFGLAEHRAYPDVFPPRVNEPNFVYRNRVQVGASADQIHEVLSTLETAGGGIYDAQLGALYQLATGAGQDLFPPGPEGHDVDPGLQMDFRAGSLRLVVLGTDEPFGERGPELDPGSGIASGPSPDIPSFGEVISALSEGGREIRQVGLALGPQMNPAAEDLGRVAEGTGALAPVGGVDCNGDGAAELPEGAPLVCKLRKNDLKDASNLVPAIVNLVEAIRMRTQVDIETAGGDEIIRDISPDAFPEVVLHSAKRLRFDVTFTCDLGQAGKSFDVTFDARDGSELIDSATTRVVCSERPEFAVFPALAPLLAAAAPPPAAPPPGIPELASQVNSQAQFHGAAATAQQEEDQPQLAMVHSFNAQQQEAAEEYAMSSYRRSSEPEYPTLPLGGAALLMGLAYGVAVRTRDRVQVARVRR